MAGFEVDTHLEIYGYSVVNLNPSEPVSVPTQVSTKRILSHLHQLQLTLHLDTVIRPANVDSGFMHANQLIEAPMILTSPRKSEWCSGSTLLK